MDGYHWEKGDGVRGGGAGGVGRAVAVVLTVERGG